MLVHTPVPPWCSHADLTFQLELGPASSLQTCPGVWGLSRSMSPTLSKLCSPRSLLWAVPYQDDAALLLLMLPACLWGPEVMVASYKIIFLRWILGHYKLRMCSHSHQEVWAFGPHVQRSLNPLHIFCKRLFFFCFCDCLKVAMETL